MESKINLVAAFANDLKTQEIIQWVKDFVENVEDKVKSTIIPLEDFEKASDTKVRHADEIKEDMKEVMQAAYIYI